MYARRAVDPGFQAEWAAALEQGTRQLVEEGQLRELERIATAYGSDVHRFSRPVAAAFAAMLTDGQLEHLLRCSRGWTPPPPDPGAPVPGIPGVGQGGVGPDASATPTLYARPRSESPSTCEADDLRAQFFAEVRRRESEVGS
jgi:hypothetical protein